MRAPRYVELDLTGEDGDVEIGDWDASITVRSDDGDVRLRDVRSPQVTVILEDGDLEIIGSTGELELTVDDGDVVLRDCRSERARIRAEDGEVRLDNCAGNFTIDVDDGDIDLRRLTATVLKLRSSDGRIEVELAAVTGDLDLDIETDDGDVVVKLAAGISARLDLLASRRLRNRRSRLERPSRHRGIEIPCTLGTLPSPGPPSCGIAATVPCVPRACRTIYRV